MRSLAAICSTTPSLSRVLLIAFLSQATGYAAELQLHPAAARPGEVFLICVQPSAHTSRTIGERVTTVHASVLDQQPIFFRRENKLEALGALRVSAKPGNVSVHVKVTFDDGTSVNQTRQLKVLPITFPTQHIRMSSAKAGLMNHRLLEQERVYLYSHLTHSQPQALWKGKFVVPAAGRNTSSFGRRRYVNGKWWGQHQGADIACGAGTPARADNDGVVVLAEKLRMRGNTVVIDHGFNLFTLYNHLSRIDARAGDVVHKGQVVGKVGATGFVTGPHLHWEIRVGTIPVNPWTWTQKEVNL